MGIHKRKRIHFIINPISGRRPQKDIEQIIYATIDKKQFDVSIQFTDSVGHARQLSREAVASATHIIVAVGGYGTINEVASEMIGSDCILGIIPGGSGNGLARHLGIPRSLPKAIALINKTMTTAIDTATINDKSFVSIAGVGFDAEVAKLFATNKKRGFLSYLRIIIDKFNNYRPKKYVLSIDDDLKISVRAFFISFANSNQFGYNTAIAPNARLTDGLLDVCIVSKPKLWEMPIIANLILLKRIDKSQYVRIIPAKHILISQKKKRFVNLDGEAIKMKRRLVIKVKPKSLNVIIPDHAVR